MAATSDGEFLNHSTGPKHAHVNQVRARYSRFRRSCRRRARNRQAAAQEAQRPREALCARCEPLSVARPLSARQKALRVGLRWKTSSTSAARGENSSNASGECCTVGRSFSFAPSSPTRRQLAGVRVVCVNPAYTSQTCSQCGHCEKANRKSQAQFLCVSCGFSAHADLNAAVNIPPGGCHTARRGAPRGVAASSRLKPGVYDTLERHVPRPSP